MFNEPYTPIILTAYGLSLAAHKQVKANNQKSIKVRATKYGFQPVGKLTFS